MTPVAPRIDAEVPAFLTDLGIPGIVDVHVHFMPSSVMHAVWRFFDRAEDEYGTAWPIAYRGSDEDRLAILRSLGVRRFTSLVYAHKPGMAAWLNDWSLDFAGRTPDCVPTATFFPEPGVEAYVDSALRRGARLFKVHLQVGGFDPRDAALDGVWAVLAERGVPVVLHCGSGPLAGPFTGPGPTGEVLRRHPGLRLVIAHLGGPEYADFLTLAEGSQRCGLDTTMAATDFLDQWGEYPASLVPRLEALALDGRVWFGSDFPNIPYPYAHQVEALVRLGLGEDGLRSVLWHNGVALVGSPEVRAG
ncbi:MAG: amidohydrolase family protein [Candidatus Nanopelagicales bacterium]